MAQIDSNATKEQLAQMEREFARKRATEARKRAAELARLSEERTFVEAPAVDAATALTPGTATTPAPGTAAAPGTATPAPACAPPTTWAYVVVDGEFVRIVACESNAAKLVAPAEIEGLPVREIGPEALSHLAVTREIVLPDGVERIGPYAFRGCGQLARLALPGSTSTFAASWIAKCPNLEELVLPGSLEAICPDVLANRAVRTLVIGAGTRTIQPGAFEKSTLYDIRIDPRNAHLKTDGFCIYTADGAELLALARPTARYEVLPGCVRIGKKAFSGAKSLEHVVLPASTATIGEFAFANSGIKTLSCPPNLSEIKAKACLRCRALETVDLNDGLRSIGDEAFANSALESLRIPATVAHLGASITARSNVRHAAGSATSADSTATACGAASAAGSATSNSSATFAIDSGNETYFVDSVGCLYRNDPDGIHLAQMLEPSTTRYEVKPGTVAIDDKAFAYHEAIEQVVLPEGLVRIGDGAFRVCRKLRSVTIPDSLAHIGADAFIDTALERFRIPEGLVDIGKNALVTDGAHHEGVPPALREIDVDSRNPRFFMHTGALCRRTERGASIVMFTCASERVAFPEETLEVEDYAFNNAFGIRELHLNARLRTIGACGLSVMSQIRHVRIDVEKPIEGMTSFVLHFPATTHSVHGFLLALGGLGHLHLPDIMAQYDNCIASARDYHAPNKSDNASAYEQVKLIISRLNESILLTDSNRQRYRSLVESNIAEICTDIARHDDREAIRELADLGLLNPENLDDVVVAVNRLQDAAMTGYLLELKRLRFGDRIVDFEL